MLAAAESGKYGISSAVADDSDRLQQTFRDKGIDTRQISQDFLEESELGDAASLKQRLDSLSKEEALQVTRRVDQQGNTGLLLAVRRGDIELCEILLNAGANVNDADAQGVRALHHAAGRIKTSLAEILLAAKAEVDAQDDVGETALFWAAGQGCISSIKCLLDVDADASLKNRRGETALMHASRRGETSAIELLGQLPGAELDLVNTLGQSAHALASINGHQEAIAVLVGLGAKLSSEPAVRTLTGIQGLHEAAAFGDAEAVRGILGRNEVSVDVQFKGETALLRAASAGHTLVVEALLAANADPNRADDFHSETPIWRAVLSHNIEVVWLLLEVGVNASEQIRGRSPIDLAESWSYWDIADLLRIKTGRKPHGPRVHEKSTAHWGGPVSQINNRPPPSEESEALTEPIRTDLVESVQKENANIQVVRSTELADAESSKTNVLEADRGDMDSISAGVKRADADSRTVATMAGEFSSLD